jgi:hypothetical protein
LDQCLEKHGNFLGKIIDFSGKKEKREKGIFVRLFFPKRRKLARKKIKIKI